MPICSNCGAQIAEDSAFCSQCGTPIADDKGADSATAASAPHATPAPPGQSQSGAAPSAPATATSASASVTQSASQAQPASASAPQPGAPDQQQSASAHTAAPQAQPVPPQQPTPQPVPPQPQQAPQQTQQVYAQGCVSAAWSDITSSAGWIGKVALMGLINFIPILNWIIPGYCMRWSRQLVFGKVEKMPKNIFCNRAFINGVFYFVIALVISIVLALCDTILGFIPFIGWIAIIALAIFAVMFEYLCMMRAAVADSLGAGFQISKIWEAFTRNMGSLFCAAVLPGLIIGIIASIIVGIILAIGFAVVLGGSIFELIDMIEYLDYYSGYSSYNTAYYVVQLILQIVFAMIPAILICGYVGGVAGAIADLLTFRAMGHWVARYASDWATDPAVTITAHVYDILETPQPPTPPVQ